MAAFDGDTLQTIQRYAAPRPVMGVPAAMTPTTAATKMVTIPSFDEAGNQVGTQQVDANDPAMASAIRMYAPESSPDYPTTPAQPGYKWVFNPAAETQASQWTQQTSDPTLMWASKLGLTMDQVNKLASQPAGGGLSQWDVMVRQAEEAQSHSESAQNQEAITSSASLAASAFLGPEISAAAGGGAVGGAAAGATIGAGNAAVSGGNIGKGAATGALVGGVGGAVLDGTGTTTTTGGEPVQTAGLDTGTTTDVTAPTTGPLMPAAVPPSDPTFGGALTQTAPGAFTATPTQVASGPLMPAAVPPADPTFGGALVQTGPGQFSSPLTTGAVAPATVTGNDTTGTDTSTTGGVGADGSADTNTNTGGSDTGSATQSSSGVTGTTGTSSDSGTGGTVSTGGDATLDSTGFSGPTATTGTDTGGNGTGTGTDPTLDATGFPGPTGIGTGGNGTGTDPTLDATGFPGPTGTGSTLNFSGSGGTGGGGSGLGSNFVDNSETGAFDKGGTDGVFDDHGNPLYESPGAGFNAKDVGDVITKYGPLSLGVAGIMNQRSAAKDAAAKLGQVGSQQRDIASDLLGKYKSGELNAADKLAIDEWQKGAIAQVRQYYANAHQSDSSAAVDAEARVNARAEAMKEAARQGLLKMGLEALNVTDRYQAAAASAEYNADQQMLANAVNFMNAYGSWLRGAPKSGTAGAGRGTDVAAATGNVSGPDISVPDYGQSGSIDYNVPA